MLVWYMFMHLIPPWQFPVLYVYGNKLLLEFYFRTLYILMLNDFWIIFIGSHSCYYCGTPSKFMCLCCPIAVCEKCFCDGEFATVKRNKGFCNHCSKLAFLIETNADVDSDGVRCFFQSCLILCAAKERNRNLQQYAES